jgi:hypothetical protein
LRFAFLGFGDEPGEPPRKWVAHTESLGDRVLEGIEFQGERLVRTVEDNPDIKSTIETWSSHELKLMGMVIASGPHETESAHIENLQRGEPDPALFVIPSDYKIRELPLP